MVISNIRISGLIQLHSWEDTDNQECKEQVKLAMGKTETSSLALRLQVANRRADR